MFSRVFFNANVASDGSATTDTINTTAAIYIAITAIFTSNATTCTATTAVLTTIISVTRDIILLLFYFLYFLNSFHISLCFFSFA